MTKFLAVLPVSLVLRGAGAAGAAQVTGTVRAVDPERLALTLDDGRTYVLGATMPMLDLPYRVGPGDRVVLTYEANGNLVTNVEPAAGARLTVPDRSLAGTRSPITLGDPATQTVAGAVVALNGMQRTITLDNGETYRIGEDAAFPNVLPGARVTVGLAERDGEKIAVTVN
jgi:hypothetical protein